MSYSPSQFNKFMFFKLPAAFWCGVRVASISETTTEVTVKHRWINQNPFKSMYFAVQAMAAELSTAIFVMNAIKKSGINISMLVASNRAEFSKKATGRIRFICEDGQKVTDIIEKAIATGEGQMISLQSVGLNEKQEQVAVFHFDWTIKTKSKK